MADQLVIYVDRSGEQYRWCRLDPQGQPLPEGGGAGDAQALGQSLSPGGEQAWLVLPGSRVVTRELEYSDAEKKHLRRLLPYQLEESVIGDIDQFHFALGQAADGRAALAYVEKAWLQQVFQELAALGLDISRCWPAPLLLPLPAARTEGEHPIDYWTLYLGEGQLQVRYNPHLAFSVEQSAATLSLQLLLNAQNRVDHLPRLQLLAPSETELQQLRALLPPELAEHASYEAVMDFWQLDFASASTDLCQGEFSLRLPIERWWRDWRRVAMVAAAGLVFYVGSLMYQVTVLERENLEVRRQIESAFRTAVPQGAMQDPVRQLNNLIREFQPASQAGGLMHPLAEMLTAVAENSDITLRSIQYAAETGELNINVTGPSFNALDRLRTGIDQRGLSAELLSASAQGDIHSARMRITRRRS